jgi:hypothetical protein
MFVLLTSYDLESILIGQLASDQDNNINHYQYSGNDKSRVHAREYTDLDRDIQPKCLELS